MFPPVIYTYTRRRCRRLGRDDDSSVMMTRRRPDSATIEVRDENHSIGLFKEDDDDDIIRDLGCIDESETRHGSSNLLSQCHRDDVCFLDKDNKSDSFVSCRRNLDDLFLGFAYKGVRSRKRDDFGSETTSNLVSPRIADDDSVSESHLQVRRVSPYFQGSTVSQQSKVGCDSRSVCSQSRRSCRKGCRKIQAKVPRVSPYFQASAISQCGSDIVSSQSVSRRESSKLQAKVRRVSRYFQASADSEQPRGLRRYFKVVKVSRYFHDVVPADGIEIDDSQKEKSRRVRKTPVVSPLLSLSQKTDEAYLRKTPDKTWVPPRSPCNLLQEDHWHDPWRVLVICMLLNKTSGAQVIADAGSDIRLVRIVS
ncbi:PREDICTED: methyl-CpG-binding domain protein 4-like protein isoform X2 [Camelina sativa]|uniref:Methyl-CpG-binding domain protein 4-like protein isoform X2 n=1 Tax=Camelina sativa TaxID=90675 RepID=A0ABM0VR93_CAMSA|nr:PREDICTED: methyl-CpG-binding domain protein 4-like protein isoform X2 [Camelina sativa]